MGDRDLLASLRAIGPQISGLEYAGRLVDGRKKAQMCADIGIPFEVRRVETLHEACSILWIRHPERALELAGTRRVLELAQLCSTSSVAIAKVIQANKPKRSHHKVRLLEEEQHYRATRKESRMVKRLFLLEPELYAYAKEAAAQLGHRNVNRLVRDSLWKAVALVVPNAPQFQPRRVQPPNGARATRRRTG